MISKLKLIECPRDAMQGIKPFISTDKKIKYINSLLNVGFDTIDVGSFVSPKAIPQMRDTAQVIAGLNPIKNNKLLVIVANVRGALEAVNHPVHYLGYPFSISEIFQMRNTGKTISGSLEVLDDLVAICDKHQKELVVYLSMGFGNPYGEPWSVDLLLKWVGILYEKGIRIMSLSDTIGSAHPKDITQVYKSVIPKYKNVEFGAHFHCKPNDWKNKVEAAFVSGCKRFDTAVMGYGGCPMAKDDLTGNLPTEKLLSYCNEQKVQTNIDPMAFESAFNQGISFFSNLI